MCRVFGARLFPVLSRSEYSCRRLDVVARTFDFSTENEELSESMWLGTSEHCAEWHFHSKRATYSVLPRCRTSSCLHLIVSNTEYSTPDKKLKIRAPLALLSGSKYSEYTCCHGWLLPAAFPFLAVAAVANVIELGELLCDSLDEASSSTTLRFAVSSEEVRCTPPTKQPRANLVHPGHN